MQAVCSSYFVTIYIYIYILLIIISKVITKKFKNEFITKNRISYSEIAIFIYKNRKDVFSIIINIRQIF